MKVRELKEELDKYDDDLDVVVSHEYEVFLISDVEHYIDNEVDDDGRHDEYVRIYSDCMENGV